MTAEGPDDSEPVVITRGEWRQVMERLDAYGAVCGQAAADVGLAARQEREAVARERQERVATSGLRVVREAEAEAG